MREYFIDKDSPYAIEIYAKDKEAIISFLTQHDRMYVCEQKHIVAAFSGFTVLFTEYSDTFWTEYPYWKLDSNMKLTIYDVDFVHILTQKEHMKEENKDLLKWANVYQYTLTGILEEDLFHMYKILMMDDEESEQIDESDLPKLKECLIETYLEILELNKINSSRQSRRFSELKYSCS